MREIREIDQEIAKYTAKRDQYNIELYKNIRDDTVETMLITFVDIRMKLFELGLTNLTKEDL